MNKRIVFSISLIFGVILVILGVMAFMNLPLPDFYPPKALAFLQALGDTGYMSYVTGIIQILVGLMFITRRYVALGAIILMPISFNIVIFHLFLDLKTIIPGLIIFALNIFILYTEHDKYKSLLRSK
ncbi:MAG TPA: DoxX protein [Candidatus Nanoarchaeia archaeon]|nr:DoxX protein [Candidatus Nanoarchaeia archaeon]